MKFSLHGDHGLEIFGNGYPKSQRIDCDTNAPVDAIEATVNAGQSSLETHPAETTEPGPPLVGRGSRDPHLRRDVCHRASLLDALDQRASI